MSTILDGACLAFVQFSSVTFICNGIASSSGSDSTPVIASLSVAPVASNTGINCGRPVAPSVNVTAPIPITAGLAAEVVPTGVKSSRTDDSAGPLAKTFGSSPDTFTGVAVKLWFPFWSERRLCFEYDRTN